MERPDQQTVSRDVSWLPSWVTRLGVPVWVCDPQQRLCLLGENAARMLGVDPVHGAGPPCYSVLDARDASGEPFCQPDCAVLEALRAKRALPPFELETRSADGEPHWLRVLALPFTAPDGGFPWIVHVALEVDRAHRLEQYLQRVATRSRGKAGDGRVRLSVLTPREREVLDHLAKDLDPQRVAVVLGVRYPTVRNHIQHMLAKLELHSIEEAVAARLLA